jgi:hypothetical protein
VSEREFKKFTVKGTKFFMPLRRLLIHVRNNEWDFIQINKVYESETGIFVNSRLAVGHKKFLLLWE